MTRYRTAVFREGRLKTIDEVVGQWWPMGEMVAGLPPDGWQFQVHITGGGGRYRLELSIGDPSRKSAVGATAAPTLGL